MLSRFSIRTFTLGLLALLMLALAACAPNGSVPQTGEEPTQPPAAETPAVEEPTQPPAETPSGVVSGLEAEDVLIQLTFEPTFSLVEFSYPFGRMPEFTLLADGRVIYTDENQDFKAMEALLSQDEAAALLQQVRDLGFERLESHTDMCGVTAEGEEACIADASITILRVRMDDGELREIRNYANFSNEPEAYEAILNLLNTYEHPEAEIYLPHGATLFVRIAPPPEDASPAGWPLDPAYVEQAQAAPDQFTAVALSAEEAAQWQQEVGIDNTSITFQLDGQPVSGLFVPWLPGEDYSEEIAAEFPAE